MSRSLARWQAVLLGFVVLLGGLLAVGGVFAVGSRGWYGKDSLHVRAGFPEVRGVEIGTRVRIRGIDAGEIVAIVPPPDSEGDVILRLRIKGEYRNQVRTNSTVQIVSEGMIGGKVVEIRPARAGIKAGPPVHDDDLLASEGSAELTDVLGQMSDVLQGVSTGKDGIGHELVSAIRSIRQTSDTAKDTLEKGKEAIDKGKETMDSIQRDADAIKRLPILRGYVQDPFAILVRANAERNRRCYAESDLFEPGRADLTAHGREVLNDVGRWMNGLKHRGSEIVVVGYADPKKGDGRAAQEITRQQAEAVLDYLKRQHNVHKMSWVSSRTATALGMGTQPPPQTETEHLPPARIEMLVFVPRG